MFCKKCGTHLDVDAVECSNCETSVQPGKFCQKCGGTMPADATVCGACNTRSAVKSHQMQWVALGLSFLGFITFAFLGGDYATYEVNVFDWLTIPISLGALILAAVFKGNIVLKVINIIIAGFLLVGSLGWVFM